MTGARPADILRQLEPSGAGDRTLATRYAFHNDQAAFAELVRRHGPVVWAACLRVAGHRQDAEDAFQATFLVFVHRLAAIGNLDLLGNWLYGVAVRVSLKARRAAARRRRREVQVSTMPDPPRPDRETDPDLGPVIDEELAALPGHYREAIVLCDLRGASREEAARLLGVPEGTLSSRLANGRKKLAARLSARGVTLSAAAVPGVLTGGARAAVPVELAARVCQVAAGTAATAAVARLAAGGYSVKTMLLVGTVCAAAAAGVVYAARPADPPQAEPPRPAAVAKPDPAQQPKADKKADPGEQGAFTRNPRLGSTVDLALTEVREASWSSDGGALIVWGGSTDDRKQTHPDAKAVFGLTGPHPAADVFGLGVHPTATAVRFTPDGKSIFTDVRETQLVSGRHELHFTDLGRDPARQPGDVKRRMVTLDAQDTRGYAFAADGKTFRTVAYEPGRREPRYRDISVRSVDAATGKTLKTLLTVEGEFQRFALSPDGRRLGLFDAKWNLAVHDVDSAKLLWAKSLRDDDLGREVRHFLFSPDGMRLAAVGEDAPHVYDATTGKPLPKLQEADESGHDSPSFTADGRLLATSLPRGWHGSPPFICVWDCDTGKLVKRWAQRAQVAFHPTKPILAVLEPNGGQTRLGLWDFAAEVPKK